MLINAQPGASNVISTRTHLKMQNGRGRVVHSMGGTDVLAAISSGTAIGFAMPLESGLFKGVRFSLNGAAGAARPVGQALNAHPKSKGFQFRDSRL